MTTADLADPKVMNTMRSRRTRIEGQKGSIFRKVVTRALPKGARVAGSVAYWLGRNGEAKQAPIQIAASGRYAGQHRIVERAGTFTAKFRDENGRPTERATGESDRRAAERKLEQFVGEVWRIANGIVTRPETQILQQMNVDLDSHFKAYLTSLEAKGTCHEHRVNVDRMLRIASNACRWRRLADISRESFERFLLDRAKPLDPRSPRIPGKRRRTPIGPRTRNFYRQTWVSFAAWCVDTHRMPANCLAGVAVVDEGSDIRKRRRAFTLPELERLFIAARLRPLAEFGRETVREGKTTKRGRRGWSKRSLEFATLHVAAERARNSLAKRPARIVELEEKGLDTCRFYKFLLLTGFRRSEAASITIGQVKLDVAAPYVLLNARSAKNRTEAKFPIRDDLASELREWIDDRRRRSEVADQEFLQQPLFKIPVDAIVTFDRDLAAAGIAKVDSDNRSLDLHCLRHTFATHLTLAGASPRVAQAACRHGNVALTLKTYFDDSLLDVRESLDFLPPLSIHQAGSDPLPV